MEEKFTMIPDSVLEEAIQELNKNELQILFYLYSKFNPEKDYAYPSVENISEKTGISKNKISTVTGILQKKGYIIKEEHHNIHSPTNKIYYLKGRSKKFKEEPSKVSESEKEVKKVEVTNMKKRTLKKTALTTNKKYKEIKNIIKAKDKDLIENLSVYELKKLLEQATNESLNYLDDEVKYNFQCNKINKINAEINKKQAEEC